MTEILPRLLIGVSIDAKYAEGMHVITVAADSPHVGDQKFNLVDGPGNDPEEFNRAANAVADAYRDLRKPILVHCIDGRSRSAAVIIAALKQIKQIDVCQAYDFMISAYDKTRIHPYLALLLVYG